MRSPDAEARGMGSWLVETVFEAVRARGYPERPSRIGAVHLFRAVQAAEAFARRYRQPPCWIYRCRIESGEPFHCYMDWVNRGVLPQSELWPQLEVMQARAEEYWKGAAPQGELFSEALVQGRVVVEDLIGAVAFGQR